MAKEPGPFPDRMARTDQASREIIGKEVSDRNKKTAHLRALRLAQDEASPPPQPVKQRSQKSRTERVRANLDRLRDDAQADRSK
jgi:hypothetical protein